MGRVSGPDKSTSLNGQAAARAGYTTDQAKLKSLRQSGVFCFWCLESYPGRQRADARPSQHSVSRCIPLVRFILRELHLFPSLCRHTRLGFPDNDFNIPVCSFTLINLQDDTLFTLKNNCLSPLLCGCWAPSHLPHICLVPDRWRLFTVSTYVQSHHPFSQQYQLTVLANQLQMQSTGYATLPQSIRALFLFRQQVAQLKCLRLSSRVYPRFLSGNMTAFPTHMHGAYHPVPHPLPSPGVACTTFIYCTDYSYTLGLRKIFKPCSLSVLNRVAMVCSVAQRLAKSFYMNIKTFLLLCKNQIQGAGEASQWLKSTGFSGRKPWLSFQHLSQGKWYPFLLSEGTAYMWHPYMPTGKHSYKLKNSIYFKS